MNKRAALIISCSREEADATSNEAESQRRTMSAYMLNVVLRSAETDESLATVSDRLLAYRIPARRDPGRRTTMLIRCSAEETTRIRVAAKRRATTISGYVLICLHRSWNVTTHMATKRDSGR